MKAKKFQSKCQAKPNNCNEYERLNIAESSCFYSL
jgi:hypothetical protein